MPLKTGAVIFASFLSFSAMAQDTVNCNAAEIAAALKVLLQSYRAVELNAVQVKALWPIRLNPGKCNSDRENVDCVTLFSSSSSQCKSSFIFNRKLGEKKNSSMSFAVSVSLPTKTRAEGIQTLFVQSIAPLRGVRVIETSKNDIKLNSFTWLENDSEFLVESVIRPCGKGGWTTTFTYSTFFND